MVVATFAVWALAAMQSPFQDSAQSTAPLDPAVKGLDAVARYQCLSCHQADPATEKHVWSEQAPGLAGIGERSAPAWLMGRVTDPLLSGGHRHMPDMMGDMSMGKRIEVANDIIHFLYQQKTFEFEPVEVNGKMVERGQKLFESVGCLPCHDDRFQSGALSSKYSVASLRDVLLDPLKARPGGTMPDSRLTTSEATDIATWLLREQFSMAKIQQVPGLRYSYYEHGDWPSSGVFDWSALEPVEVGTANLIHHNYGSRREKYGLVLEGYFEVPQDGEYHFSTRSDDGSNLWIGGNQVVDNSGIHGPKTIESEPVQLQAGRHPIRVTFYEQGGGEELSVKWAGPDFEWREMRADELWHRGIAPEPFQYEPWQVDDQAAERGRDWFAKLSCGSCHTDVGVKPSTLATPWPELQNLDSDCLQPRGLGRSKSKVGVPFYAFKGDERESIVRLMEQRTSMLQPPAPAQVVQRGLQRFQCLSCHESTDELGQTHGGPPEALLEFFTSTDDLGDEGRFPPNIGDAGAKFKAHWLENGLVNGIQIRPAMNTRMPAFGEAAKPLAAALSESAMAAVANSGQTPPGSGDQYDPFASKAGHELVGVGGLSCIICHGAGGYPSIGVQGPDLLTMHERLQEDWFRRWMEAPPAMSPGTRMPAFWVDGKSVAAAHILDGDMDAQIDAIWQYLSLGNAAQLPKGLVVDQSEYDLVPVERPIYFGTFMKGLSARVLTVGFPQRVNLAFDQHNVRAAQAWQGDFINAQGTWQGRAGQLETPAGSNVLNLPPGAAVAVIDGVFGEWPEDYGKEAGWRYKGHSRNSDGFPSFHYQWKDLVVEESWAPHVVPGAIGFERSFNVTSSTDRWNVVVRAGLSQEGKLSFDFRGEDFMTREKGQFLEYLIQLKFKPQGEQFVAQTSYLMTW